MTLTQERIPSGDARHLASPAGPQRRGYGNVIGSMTTVLSIMLLVFVAEMVLVGPVRHARDQDALYKEFRSWLAEGVAPTGQFGKVNKKNGSYTVDEKKLVPVGSPVALLTIPSLGIKEVVSEGTTSGVLMSGPGHRRDTPLPGQAGTSVIFGRQATYGGPFGRLHDIKVGAEIAVTTGQASQLFTVTGIRRPGDAQDAYSPDMARLMLTTGDGTPYLSRDAVRVDARAITPVQPAAARPLTGDALGKSEDAMKGDRSGLLRLLLWSQLLLIVAAALAWVRTVWGKWQTWMVALPVIVALGLQVARPIAQLLPNLL